jgi:hypothetical protein
MRRIAHRSGAALRRSSAALAAAALVAALSPGSLAAAAEGAEVVQIMSPEAYEAGYQEAFGEEMPTDLSEVPTSPVPELIRNTDGELIDTSQTSSVDQQDLPESDGTVVVNANEPGGGSGSATPWWTVLYSYSDTKKNHIFVRYGNSSLGYQHFAGPHNLRNRKVFEALMTTKPVKTTGAKLDYQVWIGDPSKGRPTEKVHIASWQAARTDDGKFTTPDWGYVGVITAYCEGKTKCPDYINKL